MPQDRKDLAGIELIGDTRAKVSLVFAYNRPVKSVIKPLIHNNYDTEFKIKP